MEPSGWHVGFSKRELAVELIRRMNWEVEPYRIQLQPLTSEQLADLLAKLDGLTEIQHD